jgi:hypothetical protein
MVRLSAESRYAFFAEVSFGVLADMGRREFQRAPAITVKNFVPSRPGG